MVTRRTSTTVIKALAALATFAVSTIVVYWAWRHLLNVTISAWLSLAIGFAVTVAEVLNFDRVMSGPALGRRR